MSSRDWTAPFRDLAGDLTSIEVNTIEATGVTGRKMPPWPHALIDIAQKYADWLEGPGGLDLAAFRANPQAAPPAALDSSAATFDLLRRAAQHALEAAPPEGADDDGRRAILLRIKRSCDLLKAAIRRLEDKPATATFVGLARARLAGKGEPPRPEADIQTLIRKIWDIGTDRILLQTVVQLDGDVVFRAGRGMTAESRRGLMEAHERAVTLSLGHWQALFDLVLGLISRRGGRLIGGE